MQIRCPVCERPITLEDSPVDDDTSRLLSTISGFKCPDCGFVQRLNGADATMSYAPDVGEGTQVAHFTLMRRLGQGAFGTVWLAHDTTLGREVALKMPVSRGDEATSLLREAQTAATLKHANIVSIYEVGTEGGRIFIASEFIDGLTLRDFLSSGTPEISRTIELLETVASALHHAHERGIVHRDVKPGNILLNAEGRPFVTDFGLAKRISSDETISSEGLVLGTIRYMSPEQARGQTRETDHRADIYAIGVILFQMLTGHTPYRGNARAIHHQKLSEDAPSPRKLMPSLPKDLETVCLKCLEREPGKRYQSALEVVEELGRFRRGEPIKARPITSLERAWRWCHRRPAVALLLAGLILSLSGGLIGVSFFYGKAARSADLTRRALYRSQMNLTAKFLAEGDVVGMAQTLERIASNKALARMRGFEWYYHHASLAPFVQLVNQGVDVTDVAISREGDLFASCGNDRQIFVWSTKTGDLLRTMSLESKQYTSIHFSPTSSLLAAGSSDGMIRIWNPRKDDALLHEMKHGPPVTIIRFSADGKRLLSVGASGAVRVWEVTTEALIREIPTGKSDTHDVRFSPNGGQLAIAKEDGLIRIADVANGGKIPPLGPNLVPASLAISDDGGTLVSGSYGGFIRIWSTQDWVLRHRHQIELRTGDMEFVKGQPILAILASSGTLLLYDTAKQHEIRRLTTHSLTHGHLARSANGKFLVVGSGDGTVKVIRIRDLMAPNVFWHDADVRSVAYCADGQCVVTASSDGDLRIWEIGKGQWQRLGDETDLAATLTTAAVQPHGNLIAATGAGENVVLFDQTSRQAVQKIDVASSSASLITFSPTGHRLAIVDRDGQVVVYGHTDWTTPEFKVAARESRATALSYARDDRRLVVAYEDGSVGFFDGTNAAPGNVSLHLDSIPRELVFCEAGRLLAVATQTGEIHLYDVVRQEVRTVIKGHSGRINAVTVLPNGTTLVSGGRDKTLKLWDTTSGEQITTLEGHSRQIFAIAVSPDGETIVSGGLEGDVRIWTTKSGGP